MDQVAQLLEADAADCYLFTPDRGSLRCAAVRGLDPAVVGFEFPVGHGLAGLAIAEAARYAKTAYQEIDDPILPHPRTMASPGRSSPR